MKLLDFLTRHRRIFTYVDIFLYAIGITLIITVDTVAGLLTMFTLDILWIILVAIKKRKNYYDNLENKDR